MVIKYDTHYECLKRKKIFQDDFCLLSVRRQDIDQIRLWRNAQLNVLRQNKEISQREQIDYYENNIFPELRFSVVSMLSISTLHPILPKIESSDTAIANPPLEQSCTDLTNLFFINDNTTCM